MPNCLKCNYSYPPQELTDGYCNDCLPPEIAQKKLENLRNEQEFKEVQLEKLNTIILTTEMNIKEDVERIELISSECVYGINIVKDFFSGIRNVVGGNVKSLETSLKDAKNEVMNDFREQAFALGGDAVIAIKIEHTYNNAGGGSIMSVLATGTVVKLKV